MIGIEARSKKRLKQTERVQAKANQLFEKQFPNPDRAPSNERFHDKWMLYLTNIADTFGVHKDYRRAFNFAVKQILIYQKKYSWKVTPPSYLVTDKPPRQLRTLEWTQRSWQVYAFYQDWFEQLTSKPTRSQPQSFRNVVLSFMFHSGNCSPCVVQSFVDAISDDNYPIQQWNETAFISLCTDDKSFNTNIKVEGQHLTHFHCYLHPFTLGLMRIWHRWKEKSWHAPENKSCLMRTLTDSALSITFDQFCHSAVYVCEQHTEVAISQALTEYQIGKIKSYSVPTCDMVRLAYPQVALVENIKAHNELSAPNVLIPKKNNNESDTSFNTYQKLKACFYPKNRVQTLSKKDLSKSLKNLTDQMNAYPSLISERMLVDWYLHKLNTTCGVATIKRYHANLSRKWLYLCNQNRLETLDSDELESIYRHAIESQSTAKSQKYFTERLKDLHSFAVTHYDFSEVTTQYLHSDPTQSHTRAGYIDEALFLALIEAINTAHDLHENDKLCLQTICIIAYRCGLRISEIKKLRLKDVELSQIGWLSIRSSYLGKNKTASSLRKVPLHPLLLDYEKEIVARYFHLKFEEQPSKTKPFFSLGEEANLPINTFEVSHLIGALLKTLSLNDHLVFHHLRHSCLSKLQIVLEVEDCEYTPKQLIPYNQKQLKKIRNTLFGASKLTGYAVIAAFAGHESPSMTFMHYFHFSDWIVAHNLQQAKYPLAKNQACHLGLLPKSTLNRININDLNATSNSYLLNKLHVSYLAPKIKEGRIPTLSLEKTEHELISIPICYQALTLYSDGFQRNEICTRFRLKPDTLAKWIDNANRVKRLFIESRGKQYSRHFTKARTDKLLPAQLKTREEQLRLTQYASKLKTAYIDSSKRSAIKSAVIYALEHTSTSRSGVYLSSPEELAVFIQATHPFIPKSHWRAATQFIEKSIMRDEWKSVLKGITTYSERKPSGRSKKSNGAVRLELVHPKRTQEPMENIKQSSSALIYLFHMMGIMML